MSADPNETQMVDGDNMAKLLDVIRSCQTEQTLDWIERWATDHGYTSVSVAVALKAQRAEIANRPRLLF